MEQASTISSLESYFDRFRRGIIGHDQKIQTPHGNFPMVYADWTASGRLYEPIEEKLRHQFGPFVANTHTETTTSGTAMTNAYHEARSIIKKHVNAGPDDVIIFSGTGMTGAVNKFQRLLGLKVPEHLSDRVEIRRDERPVVFVTHMEHHSNHTSWLETIAEVELIEPDAEGLINLEALEELLKKHADRRIKIASVTACSNVTGIRTPYHEVAKMMHRAGGLCFVDFACSAPYVAIDMHPSAEASLDAIFFSPHKFLGGPGTPGVLIFNKILYKNTVPDHPGGGTVRWTNPWGNHEYLDDVEEREDGGTPGFLQAIKTALAIRLKEQMGVDNILNREHELVDLAMRRLSQVDGLHLLAGKQRDRLGVISFYIDGLHFNLAVKLLNDRFGIQTRGGCSCAGTYGHFLLHVDQSRSRELTSRISLGDLSEKPGWVRMSVHPTMTDAELTFICNAIEQVAMHHAEWKEDYTYNSRTNEYTHRAEQPLAVSDWFSL